MNNGWVRVSLLVFLATGIAGGVLLGTGGQTPNIGAEVAGIILIVCSAVTFLIPYVATVTAVVRKHEWTYLALLLGFWLFPILWLGIPFLVLWYRRSDNALPLQPLVYHPTTRESPGDPSAGNTLSPTNIPHLDPINTGIGRASRQ